MRSTSLSKRCPRVARPPPQPLPPGAARAAGPPPSGAGGSWLRVLSGCVPLPGRRRQSAARPRETVKRAGRALVPSRPGVGVGGVSVRLEVAEPVRWSTYSSALSALRPRPGSNRALVRARARVREHAPGTPSLARSHRHRDPGTGRGHSFSLETASGSVSPSLSDPPPSRSVCLSQK